MDSLTQFALGGTIAVAVAKQPRVKYFLTGGLLATLPDLDILIDHDSAIERITAHRSFSHSLLVLLAVTPVLSYLLKGWLKEVRFQRLMVLVGLALTTHAVLDALTTYGTQLFWPLVFAGSSVSIGSVFIIDLFYSIWLLIAAILVFFKRISIERRLQITHWALGISSAYLLLGLVAQQVLLNKVEAQYPGYEAKVVSAPWAMRNWRVVLKKDNEHISGCMNFERDGVREFYRGQLNHHLMESSEISRYSHFSGHWYRLGREGDDLVLSDLRMGFGAWSAFRFKVGEYQQNQLVPVVSQRIPSTRPSFSELPLTCWD